jgi:hypothetical protein
MFKKAKGQASSEDVCSTKWCELQWYVFISSKPEEPQVAVKNEKEDADNDERKDAR